MAVWNGSNMFLYHVVWPITSFTQAYVWRDQHVPLPCGLGLLPSYRPTSDGTNMFLYHVVWPITSFTQAYVWRDQHVPLPCGLAYYQLYTGLRLTGPTCSFTMWFGLLPALHRPTSDGTNMFLYHVVWPITSFTQAYVWRDQHVPLPCGLAYYQPTGLRLTGPTCSFTMWFGLLPALHRPTSDGTNMFLYHVVWPITSFTQAYVWRDQHVPLPCGLAYYQLTGLRLTGPTCSFTMWLWPITNLQAYVWQ